jgi:CTP:molybdopterin cytidylyltransferase MocA
LRICGILLAAGAAKRFGGGKLLHPLPDGTPLGVAAARNLAMALPGVLAVVRPGDSALAAMRGFVERTAPKPEAAEPPVHADARNAANQEARP